MITSYAVAEAITKAADRLARPAASGLPVSFSYLAFAAVSFLCGISQSLGMLVGGRVLPRLVGGPIMPLSQMLLLRIFPRARRRPPRRSCGR